MGKLGSGVQTSLDTPAVDSTDDIRLRDVAGRKADAADSTIGSVASLIAIGKAILEQGILATGTFTTDSATLPADTGRTEADKHWDGAWLIPLTGAVIDQPRQIVSYANTGGVFTLDSDKPFTSAPGLVNYVIVGSGGNLVPAADSAANQTEAHAIGNKADGPIVVDDSVSSIVARLKGILSLVDSAESVGPFSYLDAGGEQTVVEETLVTRRRVSVEFELDAMTVNGTIRLSRKIDGTNYRIWSETTFVASGAEQAFDFQFTTNQHWKLTYQEVSDEGAARSIPFNVITEVIE